MAMFLKRYASDLLVLAACLGFGCFVLAQACRDNQSPSNWGAARTPLVLAGR